MAHDVFISYSSQDKAIADAVCASLENRKIRCWVAPRDVLPGIPYGEAIINGINQSRLLVLVFSSNSNNSPQVMREIERAVHKGIAILPMRIDNVIPTKAMEYFVSSSHWLDAMTPPLEKHLQKLCETVQLILTSTTERETAVVQPSPATAPVLKVVPWWKKYKGAPLFGVVAVALVAIFFINSFMFSGKTSTPTPTGATLPPATTTPATTEIPNTSNGSPVTPVAGSGPQLLFQDGFSNPESGFKRFSDDDKQTSYDNGEYVFTLKKWNYFYWTINENWGQLENLTLEVDARLVSGSNQGNYGLAFRVQKDTGDFYCFTMTGEGNVIFRKRSSSQWTLVKEWTRLPYVKIGSNPNHLKIIADGSKCDLYINDNLVATLNDVQSVPGYMGLIIVSKVAPVCCHFDNIKVYSVGSPQK